jgi:hypothetical protein
LVCADSDILGRVARRPANTTQCWLAPAQQCQNSGPLPMPGCMRTHRQIILCTHKQPCVHPPPPLAPPPPPPSPTASQVLYDAFFKHQRKPKMTGLGELYYEGKEFEAQLEHLKPGVLSEDLRTALGMADSSPPPWLVNMQRYGPPPSYPNLKVPGLNAPIPPGAQFGYQVRGGAGTGVSQGRTRAHSMCCVLRT